MVEIKFCGVFFTVVTMFTRFSFSKSQNPKRKKEVKKLSKKLKKYIFILKMSNTTNFLVNLSRSNDGTALSKIVLWRKKNISIATERDVGNARCK